MKKTAGEARAYRQGYMAGRRLADYTLRMRNKYLEGEAERLRFLIEKKKPHPAVSKGKEKP